MFLRALVAMIGAVLLMGVNAQRDPTLDDIATAAAAYRQAGQAYLQASKSAAEAAAAGAGCVRDETTGACTSFLKSRSPIAGGVMRGLIARVMGADAADTPERLTQSPIVQMHLHA